MKCTTGILLSGLLFCGAAHAQLSTSEFAAAPLGAQTNSAVPLGRAQTQTLYASQSRNYGIVAQRYSMWAQNATTIPKADATVPAARAEATAVPDRQAEHSYRLRYILTEFDDGKQTAEQHLTMVQIANGKSAIVKLGSKVPVATSSWSGGPSSSTGVQTQYNYYDIGTTLQASLSPHGNGDIALSTTADQATFVTPPEGAMRQPIVRNAHMDATIIIKNLGETVRIGSFDIPSSTHRIDLAVVVERVN